MKNGNAALGRFSVPAIVILASLSSEPKHGYAIMVEAERLLGTSMGPGTLYGAIARLEESGLVSGAATGRRRIYRLTASGRAELQRQLRELSGFTRVVERLAAV